MCGKWGIILKNKAIIATLKVWPSRSPGTNEADQLITFLFRRVVSGRAQMIHLFETDGDKHFEVLR